MPRVGAHQFSGANVEQNNLMRRFSLTEKHLRSSSVNGDTVRIADGRTAGARVVGALVLAEDAKRLNATIVGVGDDDVVELVDGNTARLLCECAVKVSDQSEKRAHNFAQSWLR